jgi:hypothetical protein
MRPLITILLALVVSAVSAVPAPANAGVDVHVNIGLPVAPPLVVVQPGISVVEDWDEEVFFVSPYYWVRRGDFWYRARSPRATFRVAPTRVVPVALVRMPPGQYVKYKSPKHHHGHDHGHGHHGGERHGHGGHGHDGHGHGKKKH